MENGFAAWMPNGFGSRAEWKAQILARGCYEPAENERIFDKWFRPAPKVAFRRASALYDLRKRTICDVGCAYGANLFFTPAGSYGLEVNSAYVRFARSLGLEVHERDVVQNDLSDLPRVDAVWCSALIEHVESPHILLRKLHLLLKPDGLLLLFAPIFPMIASLRHVPKYGRNFTSHLHEDHVSAFTRQTLRFTCERAGFQTIEVTALYRKPFSVFNRSIFLPATCMYVGRALESWDYPAKSSRRAALNDRGFVDRAGHRGTN